MPRTKPKPLPTASEREVTAAVLEAAKMLGVELQRRNVAAFTNPSGRTVRCGQVGDSDWYGTLPGSNGVPGGRMLAVEIKAESFDPRKLRGKKREHFDRQLARLRKTNAAGGCGLWVRSGADFMHAMRRVLSGWKVEIDSDGLCWVTDEETI